MTSCDTVEDVTHDSAVEIEESGSIFQYWISIFSGPLLACFIASFFFLIPTDNALTNPEKWYEFQILILLIWVPIMYWTQLTYAKYISDLVVVEKLKTYGIMLIAGHLAYVIGIAIYYYVWTSLLELTLPMPRSYYNMGILCFAAISLALWFRYILHPCNVLNFMFLKSIPYF